MNQMSTRAIPFIAISRLFVRGPQKPSVISFLNQKFLPLLTNQQIDTRMTQMLKKITLYLIFSLGMNHDKGECPDGVNIMASYPAGKRSAFQWSPCSKNYLQQFLK